MVILFYFCCVCILLNFWFFIGSFVLMLVFIDEGLNLLEKYYKIFFMSCYDNYMDFFFILCLFFGGCMCFGFFGM